MTILNDRTRTCKKVKRCEQCGRMIEVGQRYRKQVFVDGDLQTYRAHEDCDDAASKYSLLSNFDPRYDAPIPLRELVEEADRSWFLERYPRVAARLFGEVE